MAQLHSQQQKPPQRLHKQRQEVSPPTPVLKRCTPYGTPDDGDKIKAYTDTEITWDVDCLDDLDLIDIYLYDVSGDSTSPLHGWANVPTASGNLTTKFYPSWWNATEASDRDLQLQYINSGDPLWATTFSTGPTFTVTWNGTAPPAQVTQSGGSWNDSVEAVTDPTDDGAALTKGQMAAAILLPILFAVAAVGSYLFWNRRKSESRPKRWSQAVDQRMSMMSAAGDSWAPPAPRPGSVAWSHMQRQSTASGAAPSLRHRRTDSSDSNFFAAAADASFSSSTNAAGLGVQRPSPPRQSYHQQGHERSFSASSSTHKKSGHHSAKPSLSGEVMKELMGSKRASRISFVGHHHHHHAPARPSPAATLPRVGQQNGFRSSMASTSDPFQDAPEWSPSPGFKRGGGGHHQAKPSFSSSLRNEYMAAATAAGNTSGHSSVFAAEEEAGDEVLHKTQGQQQQHRRQSHLSQSSPPLSTAGSSPQRHSRFSGFFASQQQQQHARASSMYSEQDARQSLFLSPPAAAATAAPAPVDRSQVTSPDAALAAYSAKAQAAPSAPAQQGQGKKAAGRVANLFGRNKQQQQQQQQQQDAVPVVNVVNYNASPDSIEEKA